ncbi:MAG: hypothetical protein ACXVPN_10075 [Bacteroidia bacterium]
MSNENKEPGKELPKIDPEKLFDETQYNTLNIDGGNENPAPGKSKKNTNVVAELIAVLTSKTTGDKDTALALLKKENSVALLVDAIKDSKDPDEKALLVAACWETGMDFRAHLDYFVELSLEKNPLISMEAITVITENLGEIDKARALQLVNLLGKADNSNLNYALIRDLIDTLKGVE